MKETAVQKFRRLNPGYDKKYYRLFKLRHPDYSKKRYDKNPKDRQASAQAWNRRLKLEVLIAYGRKCVCCGEHEPGFLTIDHKKGGGRIDRQKGGNFYCRLKKLGWPRKDYQLMCMNCNFAKGKYGYCPHKKRVKR